jgi:urea transporter
MPVSETLFMKGKAMDPIAIALWGSMILGGLTAILGIVWFATGRNNKVLQGLFGVSAVLAGLCFGYVRFLA